MHKQLQHHEVRFCHPKHKLEVNACLISSPANLGSIFRVAEAFSVAKILLLEEQRKILLSKRFKRVARNTETKVKTDFYNNIDESLMAASNHQLLRIGIEITSGSRAIQNYNLNQSVQLVIGNENTGIPDNVLQLLDHLYHIPMFGSNSSLNVAQSLGISLFHLRNLEDLDFKS